MDRRDLDPFSDGFLEIAKMSAEDDDRRQGR